MKNTLLFKTALVFSLVVFHFSLSYGQLSGTYTIDASKAASKTNYKTFTSAVDTLTKYGVSGPVVFNVAYGVYKEQLLLSSISGTSIINAITFQSAGGDSSKVILESDTSSILIRADSTGYFTFKEMSFRYNGSNYKSSKISAYRSYHINLLNNSFSAVNLDMEYCQAINIKNNYIHQNSTGGVYIGNGYDYIYNSNNNYYTSNDTISWNIIESAKYGIFVRSPWDVTVQGNIIKGISTGCTGIQVDNFNNYYLPGWGNIPYGGEISILDNKIKEDYDSSTGIDIRNIYSQYGSTSLIANNFISVYNSNGIFSQLDSNVIFSSNNILVSGNQGVDFYYFFQPYAADRMEFTNNNLVNKTGNVAISLIYFPYIFTLCNYNNFYVAKDSPLCFVPYFGNYFSLKVWQDSFSYDLNSISINPRYISDSDLHATNDSIAGKGIYISGISTDIDGKKRPNPPTIGANEIKGKLTGIQSPPILQSAISLYPNPATSTLTMESESNLIKSVSIYDITGREVYARSGNNFSKVQNFGKVISVPVSDFPAGMYIVKVGTDKGSWTGKFMKE